MSSGNEVKSMEEVRELVNQKGGVLTTTMEVLRNAYGKGRLGIHVLAGIDSSLAGLGLGHYPPALPDSQEKPIKLYRKGTPVGNLIEAVLGMEQCRDEQLRTAAAGDDASIIKQIRELVCS